MRIGQIFRLKREKGQIKIQSMHNYSTVSTWFLLYSARRGKRHAFSASPFRTCYREPLRQFSSMPEVSTITTLDLVLLTCILPGTGQASPLTASPTRSNGFPTTFVSSKADIEASTTCADQAREHRSGSVSPGMLLQPISIDVDLVRLVWAVTESALATVWSAKKESSAPSTLPGRVSLSPLPNHVVLLH